jgi:quaternary ammonium compound-resistance protein SugE
MAWIILFLGGLLEVAWSVGLKQSDGFSQPLPSLVYAAMILSVVLLGIAMRVIPVGTAYAAWTGIGTVGAGIVGVCFLGETMSPIRGTMICLIFLATLTLGIADYCECQSR